MSDDAKPQEFTTRTFMHDGDVCVLLPEDSGFEPGQDIVLIKIGVEIHIVHAEDKKTIARLLALQAATEAESLDKQGPQ